MTNNRTKILLSLILIFTLASCKESGSDTLFNLLPSSKTGISFNNKLVETEELNLMSFAPIYNGGGVAVGDLNNDGLEDIIFGGNMVSSKIYINQGNLVFKDITESAGLKTDVWCNGISIVDINGDGFRDVYMSVSGPDFKKRNNLLFINNGDLTFSEQAKEYGLDHRGYSTHSAFFDYDLDGDLDLYLLTYGNNEGTDLTLVNEKIADGTSLSNDQLFRNNGNNTFTNITLEAGILLEGYGLGVAINDLNNDGWPDIYVSNDFLFDDIIYINNRNGTFSDKSKSYLKHTGQFGMGIDFQDFNNDLLPDLVQMDMMPEDNYRQKKILGPMHYNFFNLSIKEGYTPQYMRNSLQLNQGEKGFSEIGQLAGIDQTDWSWSPLFADYNSDGLKDLIITNGFRRNVTDFDFRNYVSEQVDAAKKKGQQTDNIALEIVKNTNDIKLANYAYKNNGDYTFSKVSEDWGLATPTWSNGMIYADLDNDGDLDVVISNIDDKAHVYENRLNKQPNAPHYLQINLKGASNNLDGLGAKVTVKQGEFMQTHYQSKSRGYLSNVSSQIHFGFGSDSTNVEVVVSWPNGKSETQTVSLNQKVIVNINNAKDETENRPLEISSGNKASSYGLAHFSEESDYVDFYYEPLLPHRLSRFGPAIAKADVNKDGLEDLYIGGSAGNSGSIFIQGRNGKFIKYELNNAKDFEDTDALFFDFDQDGDMDLYVASGSNEFQIGSLNYQDRLYQNNGNGKFTLTVNALPEIHTSSSSISASDFDQDGDIDLFVGGRLTPKKYPMPGTSYLLRNDNGTFVDATDELTERFNDQGMVTASAWADMNGDGLDDLVITGEFMPISIWIQNNGRFENQTEILGLSNTNGWWNSLYIDDIDQDGKLDILAGNLGENSKLKATKDKPLSVFAKDYDENGMIDPIMSYYIDNEQFTLHSKSTLEEQVIAFRKKFIKHEEFAKASFDQLLPLEQRADAYILHAKNFKHKAFLNQGGSFNPIELPKLTQMAPVNAIEKIGDRFFLSGNDYSTEVVVGQYDASNGFELKFNTSKGDFELVNNSSYRASGDIKAVVKLKVGNRYLLVHAVNSDTIYVSDIKK